MQLIGDVTIPIQHLSSDVPVVDEEIRCLFDLVELYRIESCRHIPQERRSQFGQFLTPVSVAKKLSGLIREADCPDVVLLEPGAGVGTLIVAAIGRLLGFPRRPKSIRIIAYEIEEQFLPYLGEVLKRLSDVVRASGIQISYEVRQADFMRASVAQLSDELFSENRDLVTHAILNPPFRKINADSDDRLALQRIGIECSNIYAVFVWLAVRFLEPLGQLAAITPRSFCNGPYFRPFREALVTELSLDHFVLVEERNLAFADDCVLQETVLYHGFSNQALPTEVTIETAYGRNLDDSTFRKVAFGQIVQTRDPESVFHLVGNEKQAEIKKEIEGLSESLDSLGLAISTGRVVDFRAREHLRPESVDGTVPLIYPFHLREGGVRWPVSKSKKPNALASNDETQSLLVPMGHYVLLKRFTSKEEQRRLVATVFVPNSKMSSYAKVGFENHLNYFHDHGEPLDPSMARGLACFLNSSALDDYFRQFSGHTQVNATDLRSIRYPSEAQLIALGQRVKNAEDQSSIDAAVAEVLNFMPESNLALGASRRIDEALNILKALGVPREQQNERSALVLLALSGMRPEAGWSDASAPMLGITEMMDIFKAQYGKNYAPNTRETVRRFTVHQFVQIGILVQNPDEPTRPVNSPNNVYQLEPTALALLKLFGTKGWDAAVAKFKVESKKLTNLRAQERDMAMMPVTLPTGEVVQLTAGGQNNLIKSLLEHFCPRFTPGGQVLYLGDAGDKWLVEQSEALASLGVKVDQHGKMPDLVIFFPAKNWLVLIEAVTSHGPMNLKRKNELKHLFAKSKAGLVFVTAFPTRAEMVRFLAEISWETEVWVAEAPSHMIHFNGERFLGPYET